MSKRNYRDGCGVATALDCVGERWALLIVRELVLGPKRFGDIAAGLPGASPNVITQRLRELQDAGVVQRRRLGPPVSSHVYELTEWGAELEPLLLRLGRWSSGAPTRSSEPYRSVDSLMLWIRAVADAVPPTAADTTVCFTVGNDQFTVAVAGGRLTVERGVPARPDATVRTDLATLVEVVKRRSPVRQAVKDGQLSLDGDTAAVERLVRALPKQTPRPTAA